MCQNADFETAPKAIILLYTFLLNIQMHSLSVANNSRGGGGGYIYMPPFLGPRASWLEQTGKGTYRPCILQNKTITRQRKAWHPLAGGQIWPWPMTQWPKINRGPPLIIHNLHAKFESDWAKIVVAIVSTGSYTQSAIVDLNLWPCNRK